MIAVSDRPEAPSPATAESAASEGRSLIPLLLAGALVFVAFVIWRTRAPADTADAEAQVVHVDAPTAPDAAESRTADGEGAPPAPLDTAAPEELRVRVLRTFPHDPEAFTQGLLVHPDGRVFESTGLRGRSSLRQVALATGAVERRRAVAPEYFAEGLTLVGDRLIQLTWQSGVAFEYDLEDFAPGASCATPARDGGSAWMKRAGD